MITALYAALLTVLMIYLAFQVIRQRRKHQVAYADGGVEALQIARSAQSNALDYIPITVILMLLVELNGAPAILIHTAGVLFIMARVLHAYSILQQKLRSRVRGMQLTLFVMVVLIVANFIFLPYEQII